MVRFLMLVWVACLWTGCQEEAPAEGAATQARAVIPSADTLMPEKPLPFDTIPERYLLGQFDPAQDMLFELADPRFSAGSALKQYVHRETQAAFARMWEAAQAEGIELTIRSATRPFIYQKAIWEAKWNGQRKVDGQDLRQAVPDPKDRALTILRYSSMPGTSRHHWGTDVDLNAFENSYFASGQGLKVYQWLQTHAADFGFCQVYSPKGPDRPHGYEEEKWHWSYLPLADRYLKSYAALITPDQITGFDGAEVAAELQVIERYVMGINPACRGGE